MSLFTENLSIISITALYDKPHVIKKTNFWRFFSSLPLYNSIHITRLLLSRVNLALPVKEKKNKKKKFPILHLRFSSRTVKRRSIIRISNAPKEGKKKTRFRRPLVVGDEPWPDPPGYALGTPVRTRGSARRGKGPGDSRTARGSPSEAFRKPVITDPAYIKRCRRRRRQPPAEAYVFRLSFYIRFFPRLSPASLLRFSTDLVSRSSSPRPSLDSSPPGPFRAVLS